MSKISESRKEFERRWNGWSGWDYQYRISGRNSTPGQVEHLMWVAFLAGIKYQKSLNKENHE